MEPSQRVLTETQWQEQQARDVEMQQQEQSAIEQDEEGVLVVSPVAFLEPEPSLILNEDQCKALQSVRQAFEAAMRTPEIHPASSISSGGWPSRSGPMSCSWHISGPRISANFTIPIVSPILPQRRVIPNGVRNPANDSVCTHGRFLTVFGMTRNE